jgi:hypothetical protein
VKYLLENCELVVCFECSKSLRLVFLPESNEFVNKKKKQPAKKSGLFILLTM